MIRVVLITQEEPFFIPKMVKSLLVDNTDYTIVAATVLKPHRKNKNMIHWLSERTRIYTFWELMIAVFAYIATKLASNMRLKSANFSVRKLYEQRNVPIIETNDINSGSYTEKIKELDIDIIISISCPQIFETELLRSVNKKCINAHGTLLPRHRGVFGSWWTLFSGDEKAGSTIHTMVEKLDAGSIIWQKSFTVQKTDTQYSIAYKTKRDMTTGLKKVLKEIGSNKLKVKESQYETSYNRAPDKELGKEFHKKKYRVIKLKDLKYIFSSSYERI